MTGVDGVLVITWAAFFGVVAARLRPGRRAEGAAEWSPPASKSVSAIRSAASRGLTAVAALGAVVRHATFGRSGGASDRALGSAALAAVAGLGLAPPRGALLGPFAWLVVVARARLRRRADADVDALMAELSEAVELMAVALAGGLHLRGALDEVIPWLDGRVGDELGRCLARSRRGWPLAEELERLPDRVHLCTRGFSSALVAAERYGAPIVPALERLAVELRGARRRRLEERARQVPVRLLLPLVGGILPAFVLLAVVPLLVGALAGIRGGT
jgi:Flp pilus assembly protein TadB